MVDVRQIGGGAIVLALVTTTGASAEPPIWESDFGSAVVFADPDDDAAEATIGFAFEYDGSSYTNLFLGTNGAIALGGLGEADDYPSGDEFLITSDPMIAPFWSDMDLFKMGSVHFNDFGDRAVVTWDRIGSFEDPFSPFTFQLQLFEDGRIIFGYNGITPISSATIDENVHVGLTTGGLSSFPPEVDYSDDAPFSTGPVVLELFEYDFESFDLDMTNIVFTPDGLGGYQVTTIPSPPVAALLGLAGLAFRLGRRPCPSLTSTRLYRGLAPPS